MRASTLLASILSISASLALTTPKRDDTLTCNLVLSPSKPGNQPIDGIYYWVYSVETRFTNSNPSASVTLLSDGTELDLTPSSTGTYSGVFIAEPYNTNLTVSELGSIVTTQWPGTNLWNDGSNYDLKVVSASC